jgi:hypothetical protein
MKSIEKLSEYRFLLRISRSLITIFDYLSGKECALRSIEIRRNNMTSFGCAIVLFLFGWWLLAELYDEIKKRRK